MRAVVRLGDRVRSRSAIPAMPPTLDGTGRKPLQPCTVNGTVVALRESYVVVADDVLLFYGREGPEPLEVKLSYSDVVVEP